MKSVLEKNKIAEKTGTINRSLNSTSNVTRQVTLPPINHIYQREPSTLAKPSGVPKLPPITGSINITPDKALLKNSFYLHDMDDEDLPASLVAPLSSIVDVDPTEKVSDYRGLLFYGGFFDPRNINKKGIAPFTNAINNFNNASYKDMGGYIQSAQLRRVNGTVNEDPLHSCSLDPKQAIKFAPRVKTKDKIPDGIRNKLKEIFAKNMNVRVGSKIWTTIFCGKNNIGIDIATHWGPYSEAVLEKLLETAEESLADDVFGPYIGYVAAIDTKRGHYVKYHSGMGDHGSIKKDYSEEKEVNIFGGIRGEEIKGVIPVWGKYMNPSNNFVVHTEGSGCSELDKAAKEQCNHNKHMLRSTKYDKLRKWREHAKAFGKKFEYDNMISSIKDLCTSQKLEITVTSGKDNNIVSIKNRNVTRGEGIFFELLFTVDKEELPPGNYTLTCDSEQLKDNIESFNGIIKANQIGLDRIKEVVEGTIEVFINQLDEMANVIPRNIF